jgi:hypothetical protein
MSFEHERRGALDVCIESSALGTRFSRQVTIEGRMNPKRYGVYTEGCYFLRERSTGRFFFLEQDAHGFHLYSDRFLGADALFSDEAMRIRQWLVDVATLGLRTLARGDTRARGV